MTNSNVFPIVLASSSQTFSLFYKLSVSYLSSYLKKQGIKPIMIDNLSGSDIEKQIVAVLEKEKPKFIGFSINMANREDSLKLAQFVKEIDSNIITIAGGHPPSVLPLAYCDDYDYLVRGDGEVPLFEILRGDNPKEIEGCFFRDGDTLVDNKINYRPYNLEELAFPDYDYLLSGYTKSLSDKIFHTNMYPTFATRGCGGQCIFCTGADFNKKHRVRDVDDVLAEIKMAKNKYKATTVGFGDPCFSYNMEYTKKLCRKLIENKADSLPFRISTRIDRLSFEMIDFLKEAGCVGIGIGLETSDKRLMQVIKKPYDKDKALELIKYCDKKGIHLMVSVIYGIYGETKQTMKETLKMTMDLPIDVAVYSMFVMDKAIIGEGYDDMTLTKLTKRQITFYQLYSYMRFYIRPFFIRRLFMRKENRKQIIFVCFFMLNIVKSAAKTPKFVSEGLAKPKLFLKKIKSLFLAFRAVES